MKPRRRGRSRGQSGRTVDQADAASPGEVVADHLDHQAGIALAVDPVQEVTEVHRPVLWFCSRFPQQMYSSLDSTQTEVLFD
jgi:hypothetical protein